MLAGTPIGDALDASPALTHALEQADVIAAEDTRRAQTLLARLGCVAAAKIVSYFEGNESARTGELVDQVAAGAQVVLITDAGMPTVSDPGFRLVRACIDAGLVVTAVPGPSAVLTALAVSGLPSDRFCFEGFLARKPAQRRRQLAELTDETRTMVFFEAPHRLADFLSDLAAIFGDDRPVVVCRELTKDHEEVVRGSAAELAQWASRGARGEITVVVHGARPVAPNAADVLELVAQKVVAGHKLSAAVSNVAQSTGVRRKELYELALSHKTDVCNSNDLPDEGASK